ncbi:MAG: penicillin-binding protein 2 [Xanthomonadales bacterium]|jgi:penicillin-binding protein 2|nr:penicillin-binding protein 2 [Xanthomonadales bacterium]
MSRETLRQAKDETALFRSRALLAGIAVALGVLLLLLHYFRLQVIDHEQYQARSEQNRLKVRPLPPTRGLIFDREGRLLADNQLAWRLQVVPERAGDVLQALERLRPILDLEDSDIARYVEERKRHRAFQSVPVKLRMDEDQLVRFALEQHRFPGFEVVPYPLRTYPMGPAMAHILGYVGRISSDDEARLAEQRERREAYRGTSHIGKDGIELIYEDRLHGRVGREIVETNAVGRVLRTVERQPPVAGVDLYLSIDARLQLAAIEAFGGESGAAVAIDPRNGEVLALVSLPSYDPNPFVGGISVSDYQALMSDPERPMFNRALRGGYAPGSTLKPFVALAGMEHGLRNAATRIPSTGAFTIPGSTQRIRDWKAGGHGMVDLRESLAQSVNTYYLSLALDLGIDRVHDYLTRFSFGQPTGIDLNAEAIGVLPSRDWKRKRFNQSWFPGETALVGIGQGYTVVTPLQLAHATAILAAGGTARPPRLLWSTRAAHDATPQPAPKPAAQPGVVQNPELLPAITAGLVAVLHGPTGTARAVGRASPYQVAGKTGTAQTFGLRGGVYRENSVSRKLRHMALFMGYAPAEAPTIAIAVVVEHGGSGSRAAAPVAKRILDAWLLPPGTPSTVDAADLDLAPTDALPGDAAGAEDTDSDPGTDAEPVDPAAADTPDPVP